MMAGRALLRRGLRTLCFAGAAAWFAGCNTRTSDIDSQSGTGPVGTGPVANEAAAEQAQTASVESADSEGETSIPLRIVSWEGVQQVLADHQGKVIVLDIWSTYCPPCVAELPGLGTLQEQFPNDVVCLALNCNFNGLGKPDDERETILRIVRASNPKFQNLISSDPDEDLYKKVGIASIPVVQVYDRRGNLAKQFDNEQGTYGEHGFSYAEHIAPFVKQLVATQP